jgi:hypothetical protein
MEGRFAALELRLEVLEQAERRSPDDSAERGTDLDRHTMSLTVHELLCSMKHVEQTLANALTQRDLMLNNQRIESDLHKCLSDVSAESRRELTASVQENIRGAKELMQSHDAALARRAQAHIDTLTARCEAQALAVDAVSAHNKELSLENATLTAEFEALREKLDALALRERRVTNRNQAKSALCCTRVASNVFIRGAWVKWKGSTALERKLSHRTKAFQASVGCLFRAHLRQYFSKWLAVSTAVQTAADNKNTSIKMIAVWLGRNLKRFDQFAFVKWKGWASDHAKVVQRQLEFSSKKLESDMAAALATLGQLKELELETVEQRLKSSALHAVSNAESKTLSIMTLELKNLNESLCCIMEKRISEASEVTEGRHRAALEVLEPRLAHTYSHLEFLETRATAAESLSEGTNKEVERLASEQRDAHRQIVALQGQHKEATKNTLELQKYATKTAQDLKDQGTKLHAAVDANLNAHKELVQGALDAICFDLRGLAEEMQKQHEITKPSMSPVAALCNDYEDQACSLNFSPPFPESAPPAVAAFATFMAKYIADLANHEALERVFLGPHPEIPINTEASIEEHRAALMVQTKKELFLEASVSRPGAAGAPRESARRKFLTRVMEAVDVALSKYETVVTLAHTRFGRIRALPTCVACDRPLPTRSRKQEAAVDEAPMGVAAADDKGRGVTTQETLLKGPTKRLGPLFKPKTDVSSALKANPAANLKPDTRPLLGPKTPDPSGQKFVYRGGFRMPRVEP